jgi:hypothetical protein
MSTPPTAQKVSPPPEGLKMTIESIFATSGTARRSLRGRGPKAAGLAMALKLTIAVQATHLTSSAPTRYSSTANTSNDKQINKQSRRQSRPGGMTKFDHTYRQWLLPCVDLERTR